MDRANPVLADLNIDFATSGHPFSAVGTAIARYGGFALFLHSIHFPLIAAIKVLPWPVMPQTQVWMVVHYATSVLLTVSLGTAIGILLAKCAPKQFAIVNGGRVAGGGP